MERDSFVFYRSFYEAVNQLDDADRLACYDAIAKYGLEGICEAKGIPAAIMAIVKPIMDANYKRYENGKLGGRKPNRNQTVTKQEPNHNQTITKAEPNPNQTVTKPEPNVNVNVNDNVNENVNVNETVNEKQKDRPSRAAFVRPTVEEVRNYCKERKNNVDPEHFISYYESNGWKVGRNPMKDWKAAVRNWEQREKPKEKPPDPWKMSNQRNYDYDALEKQLLGWGN